MNKKLSFAALIAVMPLALSLSGCGGGGGNSGSGGGGTTPTPTTVSYSVQWAERTRTSAPSSALSFTLTLRNPSTNAVVLTDTHNRDAGTASVSKNYTTTGTVTPGSYRATFNFYADNGGTGSLVGTASQTIDVPQSGSLPSLTTVGAVGTVFVDAQQVTVGQEATLEFTAANGNGDLLVLSPGSAKWEVVTGGAFVQVVQGGSAIKGLASGIATVRVTVDGVSATGQVEVLGEPTTLTLNAPGTTLLWAAYQDGDNAWQPAAITGSSVTADVSSSTGKYGLAYAYDEGGTPSVRVYYGTITELTDITISDGDVVSDGALTGTVSNLGSGERIAVTGYKSFDLITGNGAYSIPLGVKSPWDLVASHEDDNQNVLGLTVQRNLTAVPTTLDMNVSTFLAPEMHTLTLTGGTEDGNNPYVELGTANGTDAIVGYGVGNSTSYHALATSLRAATDRYRMWGMNFGTTTSQQAAKVLATPVDTTLALSTPPADPVISTTGAGEGTQASAAFTVPTAGKAVEAQFTGATGTYLITASKGWLGTGTTVTSPLFSGVGTFQDAWLLGDLQNWSVRIYTNNGTVSDLTTPGALNRDGYTWEIFDWFSPSANRISKTKVRTGLPGAPARSAH